jgi:sugar-specific transcriptional regulator TrmB
MKENDLHVLGLNKYEAEVYKSLVRLGKASSVQVSQDSGVPYGRIYDTLNSLINKKLARVIPEKSKKFAPANPKILDELLKKKLAELQGIKQKVAQLKEDYKQTDEDIIWTVKGKRNFYNTFRELPNPKKFNYHIKYTVEFKPAWVRNDKNSINDGVNIKELIRVAPDTKEAIKKWKKAIPNSKMKVLKNNGVAMNLTENYCWFALIKSNTLVVIKDKPFIDLMKTLFLNTFKNAESV